MSEKEREHGYKVAILPFFSIQYLGGNISAYTIGSCLSKVPIITTKQPIISVYAIRTLSGRILFYILDNQRAIIMRQYN